MRIASGVILLTVLAGCSLRSSHITATFHDAALGQTRIQTLDAERIAIANYQDGRLRGAEIAHQLDHTWANDWINSRTPVDHPELPVWETRLKRMRRAAAERGPDPEPLLREAADFPFSDARRECLEQWVGDEPERAAQLLDRYDLAEPGKTMATSLAALALRQPHGDDRLARWLAAMADENHRDAALLIAKSDRVGPRTAAMTLQKLGAFSSRVRRAMFEAVAERALGEPDAAALVVDAVDELPSSDEAPAMLLVLRSPHADRELGHRVLRALDDFRTSDREQLFNESARLVVGDARGADALVAALPDLRTADRFGAARQLLQGTPDADLVAGLLRAADELPSRDRPRLIEAALRQPQWNASIERAAFDAVGEVSSRSSRERIREAVAARAGSGDARK